MDGSLRDEGSDAGRGSRDLLATATARPWQFVGEGQEPESAQWGYLWHPPSAHIIATGPRRPYTDAAERTSADLALICRAVNEYEALLDLEEIVRAAKLLAPWPILEALARLDEVRGG